MDVLIQISALITVQEALDFIQTPACGGEVIFVGTVRNLTGARAVTRLFYECYEKMALAEMHKIAGRVQEQWDIKKLAMLHAIGDKYPGEVAVVIAVASAHRGIAFDACEFAIDTLKETVPIWKKEFFADGTVI
ncbi:molybdenum cofactor biosynthesis protein MoaE [Chitinophaga nivalis]|uniref:Molybdopterin synthase catalytic subunit n=1 Tax=Chitinophaga nivalis TaxID=2991709 RepID=A0ABT3ITX3_9BACT|nr:molybdenum cofactor biosynthesis protein MoaE [Chitinophaga nivalis]MCW3462887.1 molybdenum cofactor biosynthesis protein MoaE [Chitinophaga nivalis]MCW3487423.1 molybdenum cofactor biosynthesis protein MoaE [Chitinophaga nivalis]